MPRKKKPAPALPPIAIEPVPPTVRREVAARVVLGIHPSTFDALSKRPDFPKGMRYSPQSLVFDTAQLLAWRNKHAGLGPDEVQPMKPQANTKESMRKMAERAQRIQREATGRAPKQAASL